MKSNTDGKRKKSFYAALFTSIGAVMVLAMVLSFTNFTILPDRNLQEGAAGAAYEQDAVAAGADMVRPYAELAEHPEIQIYPPEAFFRPRRPEPGTPEPGTPEPVTPEPGAPPPAGRPAAPTETAPGTDAEARADAPEEARGPVTPHQRNVRTPPPPTPPSPPPEQAGPGFTEFSAEESAMRWPVEGEIAMIFSRERLIYNPTLDQWRTNDDLRIAAQEGTPVRAAAAGRVAEVGNDRVYGNFVRIDNGNGWETIFSQLMDGILVAEGDIVQEGQVIGGVGQPSVFSVLTGHHLSMRVTQGGELVDPKSVLGQMY